MARTIDDRLEALSAQIGAWMRPYVTVGASPAARFYQMMAYHLGWTAPDGTALDPPARTGKRVRPALVVLTCEALGGSAEDARGPAVAVELIHNFSLVHDDIQDRSDRRHGRETVWRLWGPEQGINVGDGLFALAQTALAEHATGHPRLADGMLRLNRTCVRLCEGQFLDLALESAADVTLEQYQQMIERKTAALIECSAALGAWAAGADDETVAAAGRFGCELGIAFQYQDDLLGVWGDPALTGKPSREDVRSRKKALPMALAVAMVTGSARDELLAILRAPEPPSEAGVERVVSIMEQVGARERAALMVKERFDALDRAMDEALPAGRDGPLRDLCQRLRVRAF